MMMIGSSVDYVRSGGMRNVPATKAVEHLYATTAKFSGCVILVSCPAFSYPPRRFTPILVKSTLPGACAKARRVSLSEKDQQSESEGEVLMAFLYHGPTVPTGGTLRYQSGGISISHHYCTNREATVRLFIRLLPT
ncbi:hypothetical protein AVEN_209112-1 [Araneus ventricosus]|uniref:Uncharacterized protein n=1 Tax=Araneus ventricosus TaxID=182803 RepID=A0A4Y2TPG6_ARAVE|nr:hypothetical protein AVEN_209112-1 [Araneus ventricosus]